MNTRQKVAVVLGLTVFILLGVWPPPEAPYAVWGSCSIFDCPPGWAAEQTPRLLILWALVGAVTVGATVLFSDRR